MSDFLYGAAGVTGGIGLIVGILAAFAPGGQGVTFRDRLLSTPILAPTLILHYFLPYGLIVLTLFMDLMSQLPQGVFGIAIGFGLMILNWAIGWRTMGVPDFTNDLCEIPGMKGIASKLMPQSLLFVSAIVFYLASFVTVSAGKLNYSSNAVTSDNAMAISASGSLTSMSPSPSTRIGASWGLAVAVVLIQLFGILSTPVCLIDPISIYGFTLPPTARAILAIIIGGSLGGGLAVPIANLSITQPSYSVTATAGTPPPTQARGPGFVREQFQLGAGLGEMPTPASQGMQVPTDIAKSSGVVTPGESSDQFVCEAYKNGQLISSTLS